MKLHSKISAFQMPYIGYESLSLVDVRDDIQELCVYINLSMLTRSNLRAEFSPKPTPIP